MAGFLGCHGNPSLASTPSANRCSLPRLDLSPEATVPENTFHVRPLLLGNLTGNWSALQSWERSALLQHYGDVQVYAGYTKDLAAEGTKAWEKMILLRKLLDQWRAGDQDLFLFQSNQAEIKENCTSLACVLKASSSEQEKTREEFRVPDFLKSMDSLIVSIGPSTQGLPLHAHGGAWQALVHGKKLWVFFPPGHSHAGIIMGKSVRELLSMPEELKNQ